jgi:CRP/FNR family transcriptional regulator
MGADSGDLHRIFQFERALVDEMDELPIMDLEAGTVLIREQEFIKSIPLVLEGSIKLRRSDPAGREIVFYHVLAGESCILSITSALNGKQSHAEAIVDKPTRMAVVDAERAKLWMDHYPSWRKFVMRLYYERLANLMGLLNNVIFARVDTRLLQYLKDHAVEGEVAITHQNLAGELGTAREVISRLLKQMERDHLIRLERGKIHILRPW